jgi:transcription initiation factor TFIID subunit 6
MTENNSNNNNKNESKKYDLISKESIELIAEENGFHNINEEAINLLSSDVSYRLREIIHNSIQLTRHSKRKRLTTYDINRSLEWSDCELVFGFTSNKTPINDVFVKEAKVFVSDDPIVDLVEESNQIINKSVSHLKLFEKSTHFNIDWLSVEARLQSNEDNCSQELIDYYQIVTKAILGNDNQLLTIALKDLSSNSRISPVLPFLINFISIGVKKLSHDISQLKRLLNTIESLMKNSSLYLATNPYLNVLIQSVVHCIVEPLNPITDHWTLRDSASRLLTNLLQEWLTPFGGNQLMKQTLDSLRHTLLDFSKPLSSHYGAIIAFAAFGYDVIIQHFYPLLNQYWDYFSSLFHQNQYLSKQTNSEAILKVFGALLWVAEIIIRKLRSLTFDDLNNENYNQIYLELSHIFGDALYARLPSDFERIRSRFYAEKEKCFPSRRDINLFTTPESLQTGEELLDAFYEVAAHTDDINSNQSANLEDEISCDETSLMSDNEKESVAADIDLQIKSTISDPTLGIKLTIKKLRRDQHENESQSLKKMRTNKKVLTEPVFDSFPLIQNSIKFNFKGIYKMNVLFMKLYQKLLLTYSNSL